MVGVDNKCNRSMRTTILWLLVLSFASTNAQVSENVILVTFDGFRWQEVFQGADSSFMKQQKFLKDAKVKDKYWRSDIGERRKALLPFLWTTVATSGQIHGNRLAGSKVNVTNTQWFSYPGYQEILAGFADNERVTSNDKFYNPNETVLEFINKHAAFKSKVAAYTSWDVFPYIINDKRSGVYVNAGELQAETSPNPRETVLNQLMTSTPNMIPEVRLDAFTFYYGLEYIKKNRPRVMYFSFDETDDFAHAGEYAGYLNAANKTDRLLSELWAFLQSDQFYRNKTTLIITTDHGRGPGPDNWKSHGAKITGADEIWIAMIGPTVKSTGESKSGQLYQNQVAATVAAFVGLTYEPKPGAGKPIK